MVRGTNTNLTPDSILAILILDSDGRRVLAKYYPALPTTTGSSLVSHSGHLTSGRDAGPKGEKGSVARGNPWPTIKEQKALEKGVWDKAKRATASEILLYDSHLILHRPSLDVTFFLVCTPEENEIMMWNVLGTVVEAMQGVVRGPLEKRTILENIDTVLLALDEAIDDG
ncbi:snare-like protein [Gonapodya prolifera JEL478]|uniref:Coatomer subunit zeta n=1 Tax=Gonapodya prolifera (strain JEL478) TaxID=1344416 RepID=A0A138ZWT8_GONPJ|nr:snare-like protein [Gonapodya prolifera JEL478]|eukprot:KXS08957.1 snare-like protein [Gonapodya prolifera JEL478]